MLHFYTKNERPKIEIQEAISFTITSERIKYIGTNLPKETKDLYSKNCKMLMKVKMTQTDGKNINVFGLEESTLSK